MRSISLKHAFAGLALAVLTACGGSHTSSTPKATGLAYTNPSSADWRLVKDSTSTSTHLVLNLVGSTSLKSRGVGFNLKADGSVTFGTFTDGRHVKDGGVYELFNTDLGSGAAGDPMLLNAGILKSGALSVGIFQKDRRATVKDSAQPLLSIAIDFDDETTGRLDTGTSIPLTIQKARIIPEDIGTTDYTWDTVSKSKMEDITIALGTLKAQ